MSDSLEVAYLGPKGTFSEEALRQLLPAVGTARYETKACPSILDALKAVESGEVDRAVVPFENSLEGSVTATLDALSVSTSGISIVAAHDVAIDHCLIARKHLAEGEIEMVVSHPQATSQCAEYLRERLPDAQIRPATSTAEAVREISEAGAQWAAIGSRTAAELYGCEVLASGLASESGNVTRFALVARNDADLSYSGDRWETSLVFSELGEDRPGALTDALAVFSSRGINLTRIQSRPIKGDLGRYMFFIDLQGASADPAVAEAISELEELAEQVRIIGSYPVV